MEIEEAHGNSMMGTIRELFHEYAGSLGFNLDFQNFEEELENLPGEYAPPHGCLLLARVGDSVIGCVGLRRLEVELCEMKRLFVRPEHRRSGVGKSLTKAIIRKAADLGYRRMRLDTVPAMKSAQKLYESSGFKDIEPYRFNPIPGARYMERELK
jgi:ribosomal protein S18 acetylase RimI-like enzyme